jgi:6-phosphogluconolactonase (cycloisomerase 2 family)
MMAIGHSTTPFITIYNRLNNTFTKQNDPDVIPTGIGRGLGFSHDGRFLAIAHNVAPRITIYAIGQDGEFDKLANPGTVPTSDGYDAKFSPGDKFLAVLADVSPYIFIYEITNAHTTTPTFTKLANPSALPGGAQNGKLAWSPDGSFLAIAHRNSPFVTVYSVSGTTFTKIADPATLPASHGTGVSWHPSGNYLSVAHENTPFVSVYSRSGSTLTKMTNPASLPASNASSIAYRPNGKYLSVGITSAGGKTYITSSVAPSTAGKSPLVKGVIGEEGND